MAIQNFLSGGFYGKVGDVVGQRFRNKRIIRKYVIPHDPKTPEQQANRKLFGGYVPYAQLGMSANYRSPAFDLSKNGEWAYRMSAAAELHKSGQSDLGLIPLYPINFEVPNVIDEMTITDLKENSEITFLLSGNVPDTARGYSVLLYFADGKRRGEIVLLAGETTEENPSELICQIEDTSEITTAEIYCRICSRDDETVETITASARLLAEKALSKEFETALTLYNAQAEDSGTITLIYTTENEYSDQTQGTYNFIVTSASGTAQLKNGTTETLENTDFNPIFEEININGSLAFKVSLQPRISASEGKNFTVSLELQANFQGFCTDKTTPATATEQTSYNTQWQNQQPPYSANVTLQSATSNGDGSCSVTFLFSAELPTNCEDIDVATVLIFGTVKTKSAVDDAGSESQAMTTAANKFKWQTYDLTFNTAERTITYKLKSTDGYTQINNYNLDANLGIQLANAYTADTMPAQFAKMPEITTLPEYWQNTLTLNDIALTNPEGTDDDVPYAKYWDANIPQVETSWTGATNEYIEWTGEASIKTYSIPVRVGSRSYSCRAYEIYVMGEDGESLYATDSFECQNNNMAEGNCTVTIPSGFYYTLEVINAYNDTHRCTTGNVKITLPSSFTLTY